MNIRLICIGLVAALVGLPSPAQSAVYRCELADGTFVFQQSACFSGHDPLDMAPLNTLGDGLRESEKSWLKQRAKKPHRGIAPTRDGDVEQKKRQEAEKCLKKRQQLASLQARLRRGYKPTLGEKLRRRRDDHAEYLREFCR